MPKKRTASPPRSPVAKRKRTVKAPSTAPKATAPKKATASKATASKAIAPKATAKTTAPKKATATKNTASKANTPKVTDPKVTTANEEYKPKPPTRVKVSELQMPRWEPRMIYSGEEQVCECSACGDEFDPETELETCRYHPGELYVDLKEDWFNSTGLDPRDKYDRLRMDDELYRDEEFPDGLSWSCCGYDRWGKGCEMQSHVPYYF
ncbi:hypothetical protein B0H65DRAFT_553730 [Neurospora tetraspora]|uniref:C2H2-type domain-containing protein n=1 Tax=Neurospora tetraspora TaxID=94610 RepID=A0AAE0J0P0_9PEZI|nr:hypothetical protein B0H65DRAFT_553730 [Neurospora tetraspora]